MADGFENNSGNRTSTDAPPLVFPEGINSMGDLARAQGYERMQAARAASGVELPGLTVGTTEQGAGNRFFISPAAHFDYDRDDRGPWAATNGRPPESMSGADLLTARTANLMPAVHLTGADDFERDDRGPWAATNGRPAEAADLLTARPANLMPAVHFGGADDLEGDDRGSWAATNGRPPEAMRGNLVPAVHLAGAETSSPRMAPADIIREASVYRDFMSGHFDGMSGDPRKDQQDIARASAEDLQKRLGYTVADAGNGTFSIQNLNSDDPSVRRLVMATEAKAHNANVVSGDMTVTPDEQYPKVGDTTANYLGRMSPADIVREASVFRDFMGGHYEGMSGDPRKDQQDIAQASAEDLQKHLGYTVADAGNGTFSIQNLNSDDPAVRRLVMATEAKAHNANVVSGDMMVTPDEPYPKVGDTITAPRRASATAMPDQTEGDDRGSWAATNGRPELKDVSLTAQGAPAAEAEASSGLKSLLDGALSGDNHSIDQFVASLEATGHGENSRAVADSFLQHYREMSPADQAAARERMMDAGFRELGVSAEERTAGGGAALAGAVVLTAALGAAAVAVSKAGDDGVRAATNFVFQPAFGMPTPNKE